ncbi:MAG: GIY-YIG nuclease family protein [Minisyncoccota bacterium]
MPYPWQKSISLADFQSRNIIPEMSGVYFFLNRDKEILYIGKATVLGDRVKSYFSRDIAVTRGPKIVRMLKQVHFIAWQTTDSVLEALLMEASLIKMYQPIYNTDAKDDKSYQHIVITDEPFPRVLLVRGRDIGQATFKEPIKYLFGPFPASGALRDGMKIIRRLFPYRDRCQPWQAPKSRSGTNIASKPVPLRPCFSAQIGLCPGVCVGALSVREYQKTIQHIRLFLEGHKKKVIKKLEQEMRQTAQHLDFEHASRLKKTLFGLQHIQDMALIRADHAWDEGGTGSALRIEAYDVAHLGGKAGVGVMTVLSNHLPDKSQYRQFRLREEHHGNDLTALAEILTRRLQHSEWPLPDLIVIDGGAIQYATAERVLAEQKKILPISSVVKDARHRPVNIIGPTALTTRWRRSILLANSEAHRFALTVHRRLRGKQFLSSTSI